MTGLPEPRQNPELLGHADAEAILEGAMRAARLPHAWLLLGPPGIGKATLAFRFARRLLAGPDPAGGLALAPDHPVFRRVAVGSHADLLTVERAWDDKRGRLRTEIAIADVLRVTGFLHRTPAEGGWRVVIVDGAEDLNRNAANALLKVIEEPPARTVLLLTCSAAGRLLPTIRSRCRRLPLTRLAEAQVDGLLARACPQVEGGERERVVALAGGSIGRAIDLAEGDAVALARLVAGILRDPRRLTGLEAIQTADAIGRDDEAFSTFMDLLRDAIADAVRAAATGRANEADARLIGGRPLGGWVSVWHELYAIQRSTEDLHLDKRGALVQGFRLLAGAEPPP